MSQTPGLLSLGEPSDPPAGVTYPLVLRKPDSTAFPMVFGILAGFSAFVLLVPLMATLVVRVAHLFRGGPWEEYASRVANYQLPEGPASGHLGLALLIPVSILIVRYIQGVRPRWLASVQPGVRWRYLMICLGLAIVVLNGVLWLSFAVKGIPHFHGGQAGWPGFVLVLAITSPLQAAAEEVFFRGYLLQAIGSATGRPWVGVLGSALIFALLHGVQNPALFTHRLVFGLTAGVLVVVTGGIEAGIAAHVVNNIGAYGYALFSSSIADLKAITGITWADAGWDILGFVAFALAAWLVGTRMKVATRTP